MNIGERHRGPFRFQVERLGSGKTPVRAAWLPGTIPAWDVEEEAQTLLTDPRDAILRVNVWSMADQQFVMTFRR